MKRKLIELFKTTFMLSAFTFGGGFVIVSLYQKKFVQELGWLEEDEMMDIVSIAQSSPGPIPVNASVILGYRIYGVVGSLIAVLGTILPPFIIMSIISHFYTQFMNNELIQTAMIFMRAGVAAVILDVVYDLAKTILITKEWFYILIMLMALMLVVFFNFSAMILVLSCFLIGILSALYDLKVKGEN